MSDISLTGLFGGVCVLFTIALGVLGVVVAFIIAAVRSSSGATRFFAAFRRVAAGPAACTAIGLVGLAWMAGASNDDLDVVGPYVVLAGLLGGVAAGVAVARHLRRAPVSAPGPGPGRAG
jgi:hypothetical protein